MSSRGTGRPASEPHQHPVEAVLLRAAGAARRAEHRTAAGVADHQQIAGIDRHAEMLDLAADRLQRGRDHIAPVGDRRSAEHDGEFGAFLEHFIERARQRRAFVRHAPLGDDRRAGGRQPLGSDLDVLFDNLGRKSRQHRRHHANLADAMRRNTATAGLAMPASAASRAASATANGMIFTVAIGSPATTGLWADSVAKVIASSMQLSPSSRVLVERQERRCSGGENDDVR